MTHATAQLWLGGDQFREEQVSLPEINDGEILVEMTAATICGSDRHTVSGRRSGPRPSILGHEGIGKVVVSQRHGVRVGDRVVFSVTDTCGSCSRCKAGLSAKCHKVRKVGHEPFEGDWRLNGTYATHMVVRPGMTVEHVPAHVDDAAASTAGCAIATVMACIEAAGPLEGRTVMVNGLGMLGLVAVAAAKVGGAGHVVAVDPSERARLLVDGLADDILSVGESRQPVDVSIELSGARQGVESVLAALEIGGTAVLAGSVAPTEPVELDPEWLVRGWRTVTGVHNYEPRHLSEAVHFLDQHQDLLPWNSIIGNRWALGELADAFSATPTGLRDVVDFTV